MGGIRATVQGTSYSAATKMAHSHKAKKMAYFYEQRAIALRAMGCLKSNFSQKSGKISQNLSSAAVHIKLLK